MDLDDKYIFCIEAQITSTMLFDGAEFSETITKVKKGLLLELLQIQRSASLSWSQYTHWVEKLFQTEGVSANAIRKAVLDLHAKKLKIQKDPACKSLVSQLLHEPFSLPQVRDKLQSHPPPEPAVKKNRAVLQPILVQTLSTVNKELASELEESKVQCIKKDKELRDVHNKLSQYNPHNVRRRMQRKDAKLEQQKENIKKLEKDIKTAEKVGAKRAHSQLHYHKMKHKELQEKEADNVCEHCDEIEAENAQLKREIVELKDTNAQLLDNIKSLEKRKVVTFMDGKYTEDVRLCVMDLLSRNVGIRQVEPVVQSVLRLCKMDCDRFPQHTQINEMLIESRSLAHVQLADVLTGSDSNTLHSDGTSKFGHKYTSFQVTTTEGSFSLGMQVQKCSMTINRSL